MNKTKNNILFLTLTALFIALTYVFTAFVNIRLPISANGGLVHLGNVPLFIGAILVAEYMVIPQFYIMTLGIAYIILRIIYGICYLVNWATLRSIIWTLSMLCPVCLLLITIVLNFLRFLIVSMIQKILCIILSLLIFAL